MSKKQNWKCSFPLCDREIEKGEHYIIENESMGFPRKWHLRCHDLFINSLQIDPARPHEVDDIQDKYWFKDRKEMIKIR